MLMLAVPPPIINNLLGESEQSRAKMNTIEKNALTGNPTEITTQ